MNHAPGRVNHVSWFLNAVIVLHFMAFNRSCQSRLVCCFKFKLPAARTRQEYSGARLMVERVLSKSRPSYVDPEAVPP